MKTRFLLLALLTCGPALGGTTRSVPAGYAAIQGAIDAASDGDTVLVAPGTWFENIDFSGKAIVVRSKHGAAVTRIDGSGNGTVVSFRNGEGSRSVLQGFTITNGDAGAGQDGGGVRCAGAAPTIRDCVIELNTARRGAGISLSSASGATLTGCFFGDNLAADLGGGLDAVASTVTIAACTFRDNEAAADGGAICLRSSTADVERCVLTHNDSGRDGGAIYAEGSILALDACLLLWNSATSGGGLRIADSPSNTVANCILAHNTAGSFGGGIDATFAQVQVSSSTIAWNDAGAQGGIGGLNAGVAVVNSILYANAPGQVAVSGGSVPAVTFSDVQGGYPGAGNIDADPVFVSAVGGNFRIDTGSPCANAGDNASAAGPADYQGDPRIVGGQVDIGADEFTVPDTAAFLARQDPADLRMVTYNVLFDSIFPAVDPVQAAKFARVVNALDPDILNLQEIFDHSAAQTRDLLNAVAPLPGGASWFTYKGFFNVIASKYPLSMTASAPSPAGQRDLAMALVDLPDGEFSADLYVMNSHHKCCGGGANEILRQRQSDALAAWMLDARTPGGVLDLPARTAMAVVGDFNIVGSSQPRATLLSGDIVDEGTYGPGQFPDWDFSPNADSAPLHNGTEPFTYTWRDDTSAFAPGRLDYVLYTDSVLERVQGFVLNTTLMSPTALLAAGLQVFDVTVDGSGARFDHLPVVVDFRGLPIPERRGAQVATAP